MVVLQLNFLKIFIVSEFPLRSGGGTVVAKKNVAALMFFYLGVIFIPFDNLQFAPSSGWATISPYFFMISGFLYIVFQPQIFFGVFNRKIVFLLVSLGIFSLVAYLFVDIHYESWMFSIVKILLGLSLGVSLYYQGCHNLNWIKVFSRTILIVYAVAFIVGVNQYLKLLGFMPYLVPYDVIFERFYTDRLQYTFTEPSFTSVHAIGVLMFAGIMLPLKEVRLRAMLWLLAALFLVLTIVSGASLRALLDCALVGFLFFLSVPGKRKWKLLILIVLGGFTIISFAPDRIINRLENAVAVGGVKDISGQIRMFRIDAALNGFLSDPLKVAVGYGFGNVGQAIIDGYQVALINVDREYDSLRGLREDPDGVYSMPVKILVEHGLIGVLILVFAFYDGRYKYLSVYTLLIYLQFDSYAFYSLWFYTYCRKFGIGMDADFKKLFYFRRPIIV